MNRLLLVEDDDLVRMVAREALQDDGFIVLEAVNGDDAIRLLEGPEQFNIVVTDVRMPGRQDGVDVARLVQSRSPLVPVIVVSGYAVNIGERLQQNAPHAVLVEKPYRLDRLTALARALSGLSRGG